MKMNEIEEKLNIKDMIYEIRGKQVMLDSDLAKLYECKNGTKEINQAVKRNVEKFPNDFCFQLTNAEKDFLRSQVVTANINNMSRNLPYVFTEQGVAMLATILRTPVATKVSIDIMRAFVEMRKFIYSNRDIFRRVISMENNIEMLNDKQKENEKKFDLIFNEFKGKEFNEKLFFNGQIYDAYSLLINIIREAKTKIIIISVCSLLLIMTVGYAAMNTNLEIKAKGNVIKKSTAGSDLVDQAGTVTSGDGLYADSYESNVYTYRGSNPNNYVTFNGEMWRIISANTSDNTIKIMKNAVLSDRAFDTSSNGRYDGKYCNDSSWGCNIYGSSSTLYDSNLSPITTLGRTYNGTKYALPSKESEMSTYLNGEYYNGLNATARSMIKNDAVYKVGVLSEENSNMTTDMDQVSAAKWKGKVALIDATEYVRASTNSSCTGAYAYYYNSSCYSNSSNHNWMFNSDIWWTMSPISTIDSGFVWAVYSDGNFDGNLAGNASGVRPVVTLSSEVQITVGDGNQNSPYELSL